MKTKQDKDKQDKDKQSKRKEKLKNTDQTKISSEADIDEAIDESFPASDPPSFNPRN